MNSIPNFSRAREIIFCRSLTLDQHWRKQCGKFWIQKPNSLPDPSWRTWDAGRGSCPKLCLVCLLVIVHPPETREVRERNGGRRGCRAAVERPGANGWAVGFAFSDHEIINGAAHAHFAFCVGGFSDNCSSNFLALLIAEDLEELNGFTSVVVRDHFHGKQEFELGANDGVGSAVDDFDGIAVLIAVEVIHEL